MRPDKITVIGHRGMKICDPIAEADLSAALFASGAGRGDLVFDIGCGKGELIVLAGEELGCRGLGIDLSEELIGDARRAARERGVDARFECIDAALFSPDERAAVVACVGSTHALGGLGPTLEMALGWTMPGGCVLIGEGFWSRPPPRGFLDALGATADELTDRAGIGDLATSLGFDLAGEWIASRSDWERYERSWIANLESYVNEVPDDPDAAVLAERAARERDRWDRWKDVLGFGLFLFRTRT